jgi:hypothetical protein
MDLRVTSFFVPFIFFALGLVASPVYGAVPFVIETADSAGQGDGSSLAIDSAGDSHVAYYDGNASLAMYATNKTGIWVSEIIESGVGINVSLALDSQDNPHVAYRGLGRLKYGVKSGGGWSTEFADPAENTGSRCSLVLDSNDIPHIAYEDRNNTLVRYAIKQGSWTLETVDTIGVNGGYVSLQLDEDNIPWIAFNSFNLVELNLANRSGGTWSTENVDSGNNTGHYCSLRLAPNGTPHIAYHQLGTGYLKHSTRIDGLWTSVTVDSSSIGKSCSLVLDSEGRPRISYADAVSLNLKYAVKNTGWEIEEVDALGRTQTLAFTSLALDELENPRISYMGSDDHLRVADASLYLTSPTGGETWPVGSEQDITWRGAGSVDVSLSVDGGNSFDLIRDSVTGGSLSGGSFSLRVPHQPSRFCMVRVERASSYAYALSDSFFTIEASIVLLSLKATPNPGGGVSLSWETNPGPADLAGYKIERADMGTDDWKTLVSLISETVYQDGSGTAGMQYRLTGVNGLGEEFELGVASLPPPRPLAAWPSPYRSGSLTITFATSGGLGGGPAPAEVAVFDLQGRRVKTVADGDYDAGTQTVTWDGLDQGGRAVSAGVYFLRAVSGGQDTKLKLVVIR